MSPPKDDSNSEEEQPKLPPGYSIMSVSADEMDYLKSYWELRDNGPLFGWAIRLLHDLTKADEMGWCVVLQKALIDEETSDVTPDPNYRAATFRLKWLAPEDNVFLRLPVANLEKTMKRVDNEGEEPPTQQEIVKK